MREKAQGRLSSSTGEGVASSPARTGLLPGAIYHPLRFRDLEERLRQKAALKVRQGETSERQLALRSGYTQPHIHNVLKGARGFRAGLADALLETLDLSLQDLLEIQAPPGQR